MQKKQGIFFLFMMMCMQKSYLHGMQIVKKEAPSEEIIEQYVMNLKSSLIPEHRISYKNLLEVGLVFNTSQSYICRYPNLIQQVIRWYIEIQLQEEQLENKKQLLSLQQYFNATNMIHDFPGALGQTTNDTEFLAVCSRSGNNHWSLYPI